MNNKAFTISLVLAGLSVLMIYQYVTSQEDAIKSKYGTPTAVVVAKTNIGELRSIDETMIDIIEKPKEFVEPGKLSTKEEVVGFVSAVPIRKGEQVTLNKIVAPGIRTGLSKQLSPGKRAVAISVNDLNAVGRLLKPADRVDILSTMEVPGGPRGMQVIKVVLQDVPILAVGEYVTNVAPGKVVKDEVTGQKEVQNLNISRAYNTIVVEVDPQSAVQLALLNSSDTAKITLMLRNNDDGDRVNVSAMNVFDILGNDANKVPRGPAGAK